MIKNYPKCDTRRFSWLVRLAGTLRKSANHVYQAFIALTNEYAKKSKVFSPEIPFPKDTL